VKLTAAQRRALERATRDMEALEAKLEDARRRWAALVRELGISACARELGTSRQALRDRVLRIERRGA
jgi:DNA-binding Lrp family transcriptional regulator